MLSDGKYKAGTSETENARANKTPINVYKAIKADGSETMAGDDDQEKNYETIQSIFGEALWETSNGANSAGIFNFRSNNGAGGASCGSRPTLAVY